MTKPGEGFGVSLSGGVNGYYGNPLDETDEGIFISQVQTTCSHVYMLCCITLGVSCTYSGAPCVYKPVVC